ncbi:hypothetical protein GOP47_0004038 [Adiantum capillus-veneris]|uniref:B box-type domain-containing protein n=1 Tax=Adiantum capillus-veneris TaxID=13818 RepID=A0A9D4V7F4_ADICA|nr:hypothetical protein GOP47_0004038 [Adiantum capillus-veneris]
MSRLRRLKFNGAIRQSGSNLASMTSPPSCAECEVTPASLFCEDEDLLFCAPCSKCLHTKRARAHHILKPLRICDNCEIAVALLVCILCGGRGESLAFCFPCSSSLHSKKARAHHKLEPIRFSQPFVPISDIKPAQHQGLHHRADKSPFSEFDANTSKLDTKNPLPFHGKTNTQLPDLNKSPNGTFAPLKPCKKEKHKSPVASRDSKNSLTHPLPSDGKENQGPAAKRNARRRPIQNEPSISSDDSSASSEVDTSDDDESYGTKKYCKGSVTLEAFVVDVHDHEDEHTNRGAHTELNEDKPEVGIQIRIRKMLELGLHPDTPDIEAQQALKNAQRLLTKHNLQQADILKGSLEGNKHAFKAGMRMVELRPRDKSKPGRFEHWVYSLAHIVSKYFDTQHFVQKQSVLKVVFYGIKQNVDCAGYAFTATFNRISKLSADFLPSKHANNRNASKTCSSHSVYSRVSRMSYRNGLVQGLFETVKSNKRHQQKQGIKCGGKEGKEKQKQHGAASERDSLCDAIVVSSSSDDEGHLEDASDTYNSDDDSKSADANDIDYGSSEEWDANRSAALSALVVHSKKIGDDYLKEKKIKVTTRKQDSPFIWNGEAFLKGKRDSKMIDLGQKAITAKTRKTTAV